MDGIEIDRALLLETFVAEAGEALAAMERDLVALEERPGDDELVHALFRAAHTLKGSARLVALDGVSELAHDVEALLEKVRAREVAVARPLVTLLLRSVDALRTAVAESAAGREAAAPELEAFRRELQVAAATAGPGARAAPGHAGAAAAAPSSSRTLRVDVGKLDRMLDLSGEIAIARGRLTDMLERRGALTTEEILEAHREADRLYLDLQDLVMKARMVPVGPVFRQHHRTVRDVASAQGKQVQLVLEGEDVEVDTAVVEHIRDPLTHMVRNAIDHGIELPEARRRAGKDPRGRVALRAFHEGASVVVEVEDDGAGLDRAAIARRAAALGLVGDGAAVSDEEARRLVFEPGLSTSEAVTEISGRGVGMDVVRRNVEALHGSVSVDSVAGRGTTVRLRLPLTLAIIQGFRVVVGGEIYVLPLDAMVECLDMPEAERARGGDAGILEVRGRPLPYLRLRARFGVGGDPPPRESVVVVQHGGAAVGLAVDALHGESQTVIKPLGRLFQGLAGISGSSILGDGRVALILDVPGLLRDALRAAEPADAARAPRAAAGGEAALR